MTELFDIPESKSPRLLWMEKHGIFMMPPDPFDPTGEWIAWRESDKGNPRLRGEGQTDKDALESLAHRCGIRLWNEEPAQ